MSCSKPSPIILWLGKTSVRYYSFTGLHIKSATRGARFLLFHNGKKTTRPWEHVPHWQVTKWKNEEQKICSLDKSVVQEGFHVIILTEGHILETLWYNLCTISKWTLFIKLEHTREWNFLFSRQFVISITVSITNKHMNWLTLHVAIVILASVFIFKFKTKVGVS